MMDEEAAKMGLDLKTVNENLREARAALAKAQADVEFWESAGRIVSDPRVTPTVGYTPKMRSYGELKQGVYIALPEFGDPPITSGAIVTAMLESGYAFTASHPVNAVNEALRALGVEGVAVVAAKSGIAKLWTRASKIKSEAQELLDEIPF